MEKSKIQEDPTFSLIHGLNIKHFVFGRGMLLFGCGLEQSKIMAFIDIKVLIMRTLTKCISPLFSTIVHIRGKPQLVDTKSVKLRGVQLKSTSPDSPALIFIPEIFDQVDNWLGFFSLPQNKIIEQRDVYILYPRNFGNSDHCSTFGWEDMANDVARFMYENKISMATLGGHGLGAKIALATACYHFDHVTGFIGLDSTPMSQYYHQIFRELRNCFSRLSEFNISRSYAAINNELKNTVICPKWREMFLNNLVKTDSGYEWNFNFSAIMHNLQKESPSNLSCWSSTIGLYPGRSMFAFPEYSRFVHLSTNTLPMYSICPRTQGMNKDIFMVQSDDNPQNHWVYEHEDHANPYALRISDFLRHYDGVHVLLKNRDEVGSHFLPDINHARVVREDFAGDRSPAHYHHNWRFNGAYSK